MKTKQFLYLVLCFFSLPVVSYAQTGFSRDVYGQYLESVEGLEAGDMIARHKPSVTYYSGRTGSWLDNVAYLDSIAIKFNLTPDELSLLEKNGFVVTERCASDNVISVLSTIYNRDIPLFLTTDIFLESLHKSYDELLMNLEQYRMLPNLQTAMQGLYDALPALADRYSGDATMDTSIADVDLYVTMALSLIEGEPKTPRYVDQETLTKVWDAVQSEQMVLMPLFTTEGRNLDFSQFTVRGHYDTDGIALDTYFKCMMWLGRMDFQLTPPPGSNQNTIEQDLRRMSIDAVLMNELVETAGIEPLLDENDSFITFLVGESDNLTPHEFDGILEELSIDSADKLLDDSVFASFREKVASSADYGQRILSNFFIMNPFSSTPDALPVSYRLMGQRFVLDSYVFSNVVYDRITYNGGKVWRPMPDPLDAMYVLGNDDALPLLSGELEKYHYSQNLEALRYLTDAYDEPYWKESIYTSWLNTIRALNPGNDVAGLPYFMTTTAWHQEKLTTQLASWAQLRHDTILYAKQSYSGGVGCSYPHSYIEPYPEFYARLADLGAEGQRVFASLPDGKYPFDAIYSYFGQLKEICTRLEEIARHELEGLSFTEDEKNYLAEILYKNPRQGECGTPAQIGWYFDLYYNKNEVMFPMDYKFTIADVHTQTTDETGAVVGRVLHVGTGLTNFGVFIAPSPSNDFRLTAFAGPIMSYYEHTTSGFERLTDKDWMMMSFIAVPPDWTNCYLTDRQGNMRSAGRELPGVPYEGVGVVEEIIAPRAFITAQVYPNPFNPATTVSYTLPERGKATLTVYDILGRRVSVLSDGIQDAGFHSVVWDASGVSSGVYFVRIESAGMSRTVKLALVR